MIPAAAAGSSLIAASETMAEQRGRLRVRLDGMGGGMIVSSGKRFQFRAVNYSLNGLLIHIEKGTVPAKEEAVKITVRSEHKGEPPLRFTVSAIVKRHERRQGRILCGLELTGVQSRGDSTVMDHAYLEQYFESLI